MNTTQQTDEHRITQLATQRGYRVERPRPWCSVQEGFRLIQIKNGFRIVLGEQFEASLQDIEAYLGAPAGEVQQDRIVAQPTGDIIERGTLTDEENAFASHPDFPQYRALTPTIRADVFYNDFSRFLAVQQQGQLANVLAMHRQIGAKAHREEDHRKKQQEYDAELAAARRDPRYLALMETRTKN